MLRAHALHFATAAHDIFFILGKTLLTCVKGPYRFKEILGYISQIGVGSLPIILLSTAFAGFVITGEIAFHMDEALHTVDMIPGFSAQFILREIGVVIPSLLLVSKVGAATTAEVGTMKVTEQIDSLRLLQIDPVEYLVYPRFVACIISVACLTLISIFVTLSCAMAIAVIRYHFTWLEYLNSLLIFVTPRDLVSALLKGLVFGAVIPIIACFYGFRCSGGAEGVGSATTNAVVTSTILIIILDFVLTFAFSILLY